MIDYSDFYDHIAESKLFSHLDPMRKFIDSAFTNSDIAKWKNAIDNFPSISPSVIDLSKSAIQIGDENDCSNEERVKLKTQLMKLHPWRKGPYNFFGNFIDSEWRSDWKWDRLKNDISPLENRNVLDVGCGNGYHSWRILGEGAESVIGIDPFLLSLFQFSAVKHFVGEKLIWLLPYKMEQFLQSLNYFDTVFSMGVLYHRRSPFDHLIELRDSLQSGGELILETLVIDGKAGEVLVPDKRYAKMRNIWFIPSTLTLELWLKRIGFKNIRLIDITKTTFNEQRKTEWMTFESLSDFLDPQNPDLTVEGYPAPKRAIFIANT
ncbi:MAG: tRNA 5-methoxyuridine(34)/uridine 5-oxyacetic acid(34) synthase CmoB [Chlorobi bacterium]|nr:tRNA 5-methoxyuridine(34)/uridine 5-oxyacetic acid(34) synthase CmoB [Chlorobiota bacterium]